MGRLQKAGEQSMIDINLPVKVETQSKEEKSPETNVIALDLQNSHADVVNGANIAGVNSDCKSGSVSSRPKDFRFKIEQEVDFGDSDGKEAFDHIIGVKCTAFNYYDKGASCSKMQESRCHPLDNDKIRKEKCGMSLISKGEKLDRFCSLAASVNPLAEGTGDVDEENISEPSNRNKDNTQILSAQDSIPSVKSSHDLSKNSHKKGKGKDKVSKDRDDSNESVESTNSKAFFSTEKRPQNFESDGNTECKKLKKWDDGSSCSESFFVHGSSFKNWISNLAKGFPNNDRAETSLPFSKKPSNTSQNIRFCPSPLYNEDEVVQTTMGFQCFVQALYRPQLKIEETKESQLVSIPSDIVPNQIVHRREDFKLEPPTPLLNARPIQRQSIECPTTVLNDSSSNSPFQRRLHYITSDQQNLCNWASSSSSIQNSSILPARKGAGDSITSNTTTSLRISCSGNEYLGSAWITRFCRKTSKRRYNQIDSSAIALQADDCSKYPQQAPTEVLPLTNTPLIGLNCLGIRQQSSSESEKNFLGNQRHFSTYPYQQFSGRLQTNQNSKAKLNLLLPSTPKPISSSSEKRLDGFTNIRSPRIVNGSILASSTCFFCGNIGHSLKECSEIMGSELDELLRNFNSYDEPQDITCFCILCFRLNHWAIACPYISRKCKHPIEGSSFPLSPLKNDNLLEKSAAKICFGIFDSDRQSNRGQSSRFLLKNKFDSDFRPVASGLLLESNPFMETLKESKLMRDIVSCSYDTETLRNQHLADCDIIRQKMSQGQNQIFERIRRLQLSREDLVSWLNPPCSNPGLEGFFVRVRIGQWEDGSKRGGYQVACISGEFQERPCERSKSHVTVDMGGIKCTVDCRFVSNNDFTEDELMTWWSDTLKNGGKLPTEEELTVKLKEKERFSL